MFYEVFMDKIMKKIVTPLLLINIVILVVYFFIFFFAEPFNISKETIPSKTDFFIIIFNIIMAGCYLYSQKASNVTNTDLPNLYSKR